MPLVDFSHLTADCRSAAAQCGEATRNNDVSKWQKSNVALRQNCAALISKLRSAGATQWDKLSACDLRGLMLDLRGIRAFDELATLGETLVTLGIEDVVVRKLMAQGLIETGGLASAIHVLDRIVADCETALTKPAGGAGAPDDRARGEFAAEMIDARALRGRAYKQAYVDLGCRGPTAPCVRSMQQAVDAYRQAYDQSPNGERYYPGANLVALLVRAGNDGIPVVGAADVKALAREIIDETTANKAAMEQTWSAASLGEAYLALDDIRSAAAEFERYMKAPDTDQFRLAATVRNLEQVWGIKAGTEGAGQLVLAMKLRLLAFDGASVNFSPEERAKIADGAATNGYGELTEKMLSAMPERKFGAHSGFIALGDYFRIMDSARGVARISLRGRKAGIGTGFLVRGSQLCSSLGEELYVLTNAHVVSNKQRDAARPSQVTIGFDVEYAHDEAKEYTCALEWESPPDEYDAALLRVAPQPTGKVAPIVLADDDQRLVAELGGGTDAPTDLMIIGHPLGGDLSASKDQRSILIDVGSRPPHGHVTYLHYRTPTEPGSSGSPVFEIGSFRVVGLHRAGPEVDGGKIVSLNGRADPIAANEGVLISSIRRAIRAERAKRQATAAAVAVSPLPLPAAGAAAAATAPAGPFASAPVAQPITPAAPPRQPHCVRRLGYHELLAKLNDPEQAKEELAPYFTAADANGQPYRPRFTPNPELVEVPAAESLTEVLALANHASAFRRQRLCRRRIADGFSGLRIVAEGDSWFEYPILLDDVVDHLGRDFAVFSLASAGDNLESMASDDNLTRQLLPALDEIRPHAVLLSGGGNDLVGDALAGCLLEFGSGGKRRVDEYLLPRLEESLTRLSAGYVTIFNRLLSGRPGLKIFTHGYDLATPDLDAGEWLGRPFRAKGYKDAGLCREVIDVVLRRVAGMHYHLEDRYKGMVHFVPCMNVVGADRWHDELHPDSAGFGAIADRFREAIDRAFPKRSA